MKPITRRSFLRGTAVLAAGAICPSGLAQPARTRLVLLGTGGGPRVTAKGRAKPATLIVVNGVPYVIDCGDGVALQLVRGRRRARHACAMSSSPTTTPTTISITATSSTPAGPRGCARRSTPTARRRIKAMTEAYWQLNRFDIETRIADEGRADLRKLVTAHEFSEGGLVMQNAEVKVTLRARAPSADRAGLRLPLRRRRPLDRHLRRHRVFARAGRPRQRRRRAGAARPCTSPASRTC